MTCQKSLTTALFISIYLIPCVIFSQTPMDCSATVSSTCNLIPNPGFAPISGTYSIPETSANAAFQSDIQNWIAVCGTPDLNTAISAPSQLPNTNWATLSFYNATPIQTENIAVKTGQLFANNDYVLSFFRAASSMTGRSATDFKMRIVLARCSDIQSDPTSFDPFTVPSQTQTIYCETISSSSASWGQALISFTANDNYNVIWIFQEAVSTSTSGGAAFLHFAYPELINKADLVITPRGTACGRYLTGCLQQASYSWTDPNSNILTGNPVSINAGTNYGLYTAYISVSGALSTNNSCSNNISYLQIPITVPQCISCSSTPSITPAGPITYYNQYETSNQITLTCSSSSNYQWLRNNSPIAGETNQTLTVNFNDYVSYSAQYSCLTECGFSNSVTFNYIGCSPYSDYPVSIPSSLSYVCQSALASPNYIQLNAPNLGGGTTSTWWLQNTPTCLSISGSGQLTGSGCSGYPSNGIYTKSSLSGEEVYLFYFMNVNSGCKPPKNDLPNLNISSPELIFPNPAKDRVFITGTISGSDIQIYNSTGKLIKIIKADHKSPVTTVSVADFYPGLYVLRLVSQKKITIFKLIIQ
jgi:hypothetical protein